jgi:hypothetical protein
MKRILLITWAVFVVLTAGTNSVALIPRPDTSQTENSIASIRQRYTAINKSVRKYRRVKKELSGFSLEGGELTAYFSGPRIVKITAAYFGESGRATEEYYYSNEQLIFVFRRDYTYSEPMSGKVVDTKSNRFYFGSDRIIRWIDENGKAVSDSAFQTKQQELLETSNKFLKAARSSERVIEARNTNYPTSFMGNQAFSGTESTR